MPASAASTSARARELLERMRLEPGRYKFVRLPVRDLGEGGCGVWEVRPRLGLIGMLAGWWQLKLSSGCPLARGSRSERGPVRPCVSIAASVRRWRSVIEPIGLLLGHRDLGEELAAAGLTPAALAHQQVGDGHALGLPRAVEDHLGDVELAGRDAALELGAGEANLVGAFEGAHVLWTGRGDRRCRVHVSTLPVAAASLPRRATSLLEFFDE